MKRRISLPILVIVLAVTVVVIAITVSAAGATALDVADDDHATADDNWTATATPARAGNGKAKLPSTATTRELEAATGDRYVGTSTLGITVNTDAGEPVTNEQVTIINSKTKEQVFQGTTDNAGQIDVTLPQGEYDVIVQDQSKKVKLDGDKDVSFTVKSPDLPKT